MIPFRRCAERPRDTQPATIRDTIASSHVAPVTSVNGFAQDGTHKKAIAAAPHAAPHHGRPPIGVIVTQSWVDLCPAFGLSWLTTKPDHNRIRQGPIPTDAPVAIVPGERQHATTWAYFASRRSQPRWCVAGADYQ